MEILGRRCGAQNRAKEQFNLNKLDLEPHHSFKANLDFKKGDWVRIQAQSKAKTGTLTVEILCKGCKNIGKGDDKLSDSVDLSVIKLVEVFATIE